MYKGGIKIKDIEKILMMEFKQGLGRQLTQKETEFIQWMANQQKLEQKQDLISLETGSRSSRKQKD